MKRPLLFGLLAAALAGSSIYTVDAREVAVVTLFGKPVKTVMEPGLQAGLPWPLHQVVRFDKRTQLLTGACRGPDARQEEPGCRGLPPLANQ